MEKQTRTDLYIKNWLSEVNWEMEFEFLNLFIFSLS